MANDIFMQAFVYLAAAVIAVPVAKRLGLGSALGYLLAGVIIGPTCWAWWVRRGRMSCISPNMVWC